MVNWQNLQRRLFRDKQFGDGVGGSCYNPMESPVPDLTKFTKAKKFLKKCPYAWLLDFQALGGHL
jgi:hypothetical protein